MSSLGSVTKLIRRVKDGDAAAVQELLARYFRRLLGLARARLRGKCWGVIDEEDVVQSALAGFFLGAEHGQYTALHDRDDLWHLLVQITVHKARKHVKHEEAQKRGGVAERNGARTHTAEDPQIGELVDPSPPPDLEVLAREGIQQLLDRLRDPELRSIAVWKWEEYTNEEIASMLGCSSRTIQRKIQLIRIIWGEEDAT